MERRNQTSISEFILLGLSNKPEEERLLFFLFLIMYLITVLWNLLIILAIRTDSHLHTPMYFFLTNLSLGDICFTSSTVPKMLVNYIFGNKVITYTSCLAQLFFCLLFGGIDSVILASMAYDRYVAICAPLHYNMIMSQKVCASLGAICWSWACIDALIHTLSLTQLSFCGQKEIPHFFCELSVIIRLACSNTLLNDLMVYILGSLTAVMPFIGILISYIYIFIAVLKIPSTHGRKKAFNTCGSHLAVVCLFYGTVIGVYFNPRSTHIAQKDTAAAVMYTIVTPMLNPFIYSLRNNDMKRALRILFSRKPCLSL
ncbi:olfactory receptor 1f45-like [Sminthopsis crassicaudata]|uniref:olfactory receptor 1f45-like n=1 Tax=Sminthopsis crassicaudata TaxID=9301 RepID=UPI003D69D18E